MHKGTKTNPQDPRWDLESTKVKLLVGQGSDKEEIRGRRTKRSIDASKKGTMISFPNQRKKILLVVDLIATLK